MKINQELLDSLTAQAAGSPRLRAALDLRTSTADQSQRILNAMEPGTIVPVHRHVATSETLIVLRGAVREIFYDDLGRQTEVLEMGPGQGVNVETGRWHSVESLASGSVIVEFKDGPYAPLSPEDILR